VRIILALSTLAAGGAERVVAELANAWAQRGWSVAVLTISDASADHYVLHPRVERIALNLIWDSFGIWESARSSIRRSLMLRRAVLRFRPDVAVSFIEQNNVRLLAALLFTGIPAIVSERIDPRYHHVGRAWNLARRLLYPLASAVVVQTRPVAIWAGRFVARNRVQVIPNFVRKLPPPPAHADRDAALILAVGRLSRQKGFDLLIRAFRESGARERGMRLVIFGQGPEEASLRTLAGNLGVDDVVELPGVVAEPERWMAQAAIYVLPSRYEGFPNALLEAMAMGCAAIAADCPSGPGEIIQDQENGILVAPEDVSALAAAMRRLISDRVLRERLGRKAIEVRDRYSMQAVIERWENLIGDVVSKKSKPQSK
jgi:GalNAc-alpha-(1->4)-GalNAc-alpha-(1->3)-diNAcBac-PP-undecaprenol alpha-1,4-N-acetyl-D-galactosaminyltransferase